MPDPAKYFGYTYPRSSATGATRKKAAVRLLAHQLDLFQCLPRRRNAISSDRSSYEHQLLQGYNKPSFRSHTPGVGRRDTDVKDRRLRKRAAVKIGQKSIGNLSMIGKPMSEHGGTNNKDNIFTNIINHSPDISPE